MTMHRINLIPESKRLDSQRRKRVRFWIGFGMFYALVAVAGCFVFRSMSPVGDVQALQDQLGELEAELAQVQSQQNAITPRLNEQRLVLVAERSITDQPDWSRLLSHLADDLLGDRIVLKSCTLAPVDGPVETEALNTATLSLKLTGYARTTRDASRFVLRLEESGLFDTVKLVNTNLEPYLGSEAIGFSINCVMQQGGG